VQKTNVFSNSYKTFQQGNKQTSFTKFKTELRTSLVHKLSSIFCAVGVKKRRFRSFYKQFFHKKSTAAASK